MTSAVRAMRRANLCLETVVTICYIRKIGFNEVEEVGAYSTPFWKNADLAFVIIILDVLLQTGYRVDY